MGGKSVKYVPPEPGADSPLDPVLRQSGPVRPWERLARETDQQWALFCAFRDMAYPEGPAGKFHPRHMGELADRLGLSRQYLANLSSSFHWPQRAGAWDREVERRKADADLSEVQRMRERHLRRLAKLGTLAEMELDKLLAKAQDPEMHGLTPKDVLGMLDFVQKSERLLAGEHTDHVKVDGGVNLENLELEDLEALHVILQKAKGQPR